MRKSRKILRDWMAWQSTLFVYQPCCMNKYWKTCNCYLFAINYLSLDFERCKIVSDCSKLWHIEQQLMRKVTFGIFLTNVRSPIELIYRFYIMSLQWLCRNNHSNCVLSTCKLFENAFAVLCMNECKPYIFPSHDCLYLPTSKILCTFYSCIQESICCLNGFTQHFVHIVHI